MRPETDGTIIALKGSLEAASQNTHQRNHMNAIELLESQHRDVEKLFDQIEKAKTPGAKQKLFDHLADSLAVHTTIEEHQFYPAVKAKRTEDILLESLEEHLGIKRVLADLLEIQAKDHTFDAKIKVLKEQVEHHVEEEETDLFPKVRKVLDAEELRALGQTMRAEQVTLEDKGEPRAAIPSETQEVAILS
jgi:hemerythrin superfamily protein